MWWQWLRSGSLRSPHCAAATAQISRAWLAPVSLIKLVLWSKQRGPPHPSLTRQAGGSPQTPDSSTEPFRTWRDNTGVFTFRARMEKVEGEKVSLTGEAARPSLFAWSI